MVSKPLQLPIPLQGSQSLLKLFPLPPLPSPLPPHPPLPLCLVSAQQISTPIHHLQKSINLQLHFVHPRELQSLRRSLSAEKWLKKRRGGRVFGLAERGWRPQETPSGHESGHKARRKKDTPLVSNDGRFRVNLHLRF